MDQVLNLFLAEARIRARGADLGAVISRLNALHERGPVELRLPRVGVEHLLNVVHLTSLE